MDWSTIFSGAALVISVTSPVITSLLNNYHEKTMWEKRNNSERKTAAIQTYIQKSGLALKRNNLSCISEYSESYGEIFLFAPQDLWEDIEKLDYYITNRTLGNEPTQLFVKICKRLSEN